MKRSNSLALLAAMGCFICTPASAFFCVDTVVDLTSAIYQSQTNNISDEIRVVGGTYTLTSGLFFQSVQGNSITIRGGYLPGCAINASASTLLDGQGTVKDLTVRNTAGDITVEGLTFVGGLSTNNRGGALWVNNTTGNIRIDRNIFYGNHADDYAGALEVSASGGTMRVRNNLAFANSSANVGAFELELNGGGAAYIVGNTIVANSSAGDFSPGGLYIGGTANFVLSNNIIWNNIPQNPAPFKNDFTSTASSHSRIANDIGVVSTGTVANLILNEQSVDPQFAPCSGFFCYNFELERFSPLVDAGDDTPAGGMPAIDLAGKNRTIGPHVDIGAYENDLIFADGFE